MAKQVEKYKYKIVIKYIDNIDIFIEEDADAPSLIRQMINNEHTAFLSIGNKCINKKDIVYLEEIKGE